MANQILSNNLLLSQKRKILEFLIALISILIGVSLRLLPHPPNFAPIGCYRLIWRDLSLQKNNSPFTNGSNDNFRHFYWLLSIQFKVFCVWELPFVCYFLALPFFKNTLLGNLFYVTCFFGAYEIIEVWVKKKFRITETSHGYIIDKSPLI